MGILGSNKVAVPSSEKNWPIIQFPQLKKRDVHSSLIWGRNVHQLLSFLLALSVSFSVSFSQCDLP